MYATKRSKNSKVTHTVRFTDEQFELIKRRAAVLEWSVAHYIQWATLHMLERVYNPLTLAQELRNVQYRQHCEENVTQPDQPSGIYDANRFEQFRALRREELTKCVACEKLATADDLANERCCQASEKEQSVKSVNSELDEDQKMGGPMNMW